jgi:glycyl-tRNA synthetase beta chain
MTHRASLLLELLTEELPPKALKRLGESFSSSIHQQLTAAELCDRQSVVTSFASPRRLAVHITEVLGQGPTRERQEKLLPVTIALTPDGKAAPPLVKKLGSLGLVIGQNIALSDLDRIHDGKQEQLVYRFTAPGALLHEALQTALHHAIAQLPIPKVMSYQKSNGETVKFVRPAHGLLALHGTVLVPLQALGLGSGTTTLGHRFHCPRPIVIQDADRYAKQLIEEGKVLAHFDQRRQRITDQLKALASPHQPVMPDALVDEVTSLVEWPVVIEGQFSEEFLSVPQECLILTMQQNQKYFALVDSQGQLVNRFLLVSNIESKDPIVVSSGNERVLRARLSDAKFFFDQDRKKTLASRIPDLSSVIYHNKIGHQGQRVDRLAALAKRWAPLFSADPAHAERAAQLAKTDLLTDMVGEFPELQGVIGTYYARHDQEAEEVALAIEGHYHPRFSGDALAPNATGNVLALADKLETLVGIWGIGLAPTGDKDPFALRRHALGVVRILIEQRIAISVSALLQDTLAVFKDVAAVKPDLSAIEEFILDRLRAFLKDKAHPAEAIEAVIGSCPDRLFEIPARLEALSHFMTLPEAASLSAANKRIGNILKKSDSVSAEFKEQLLHDPAEQTLGRLLKTLAPEAQALVSQGDYTQALTGLAVLRTPVDEFFEKVMVNAEDPQLRANRLALLASLHRAMNQVGDLSRLAA